ncbi:MAG: M23 family metallopeptidase [Spirochaetales bacterium]|nr:M23 family metallopeptidase [Spirochaetales bacterium]
MLKEDLIEYIISASLSMMGKNGFVVTPGVNCPGRGMPDGKYYLQITRNSDVNILLQEMVQSYSGENFIFRLWTFRKEKSWDILSLEKNKKHIYLRDLTVELEDLSKRLLLVQRLTALSGAYFEDEIDSLSEEMELPEMPVKRTGTAALIQWVKDFSLRRAVLVPTLASVLLVVTILSGIYAVRLNIENREISGSIEGYISELETKVNTLNSFKDSTENDLEKLMGNLEMEQADLDFNRHNAYVNVLRLAEELSRYHPARKEAYHLIAENVKDAVSFGEIVYEMSRLPTAEYQARIFLATDPQKIIPLGRFKPVFASMAYPVAIEGQDNNGMGFRVSDGYMEKRADPLGSGGTAPHYAIDIVNVANINHISYSGEIVREGNPFGDVVAVESGMVRTAVFDERYGWNLEIEHPMTAEIKQKYPQAEAWMTFYAHLDQKPELAHGDWLERGETLGKIGNTGRSTGPHLHFEVRIYMPGGEYRDGEGKTYIKINPFPG